MRAETTTTPEFLRSKQEEQAFIAKYGSMLDAKYRKATISTMLTVILITTLLKISSVYRLPIMLTSILQSAAKSLLSNLLFGEQATKAKQSYGTTPASVGSERQNANLRAEIVVSNLLLNTLLLNTAQTNVEKAQGIAKFSRIVKSAISNFGQSVIQLKKSKPVRVLAVGHCAEETLVYNISVAEARLFYANGILSSNTNSEDHMYDAWRYRCLKGANRAAAPGSVKIRMPT
jgi:hypothetical protein